MAASLPFGTVQGTAPGGIPAYSNQGPHFFSGERSFVGEFYCGFKYQSVEFARRWLLQRKGLVLPNVLWPCHIFDIKEVRDAVTADVVPVVAVPNGKQKKPVVDSLLVYAPTDDKEAGHVGVITKVENDTLYVADQNVVYSEWENPHGRKLRLVGNGCNWSVIDEQYSGHVVKPLGWVVFSGSNMRQEGDALIQVHQLFTYSSPAKPSLRRITFLPDSEQSCWLDPTNEAERLFIQEFGMDVHRARLDERAASFYEMSPELHLKCITYSQQLHTIFLKATEEVLGSDELMKVFGIPRDLWGRVRHSWAHQRTFISGRFDFAFNNDTQSFKCFEYNADSAATLLECGRIQDKWAHYVGQCDDHRSAGMYMERALRMAWAKSGASGRVHFCVDNDTEEQYTALYCIEAAKASGLDCRLCVMFDEFHFNESGRVVDTDNKPVTTVWKTWSWDTVITDYYAAKEARGTNWKPSPSDKVRLCDLVLGEDWDVKVFEPLWKVIPSNKAILPIIYRNNPDHPAILRAEYSVTPELLKSGYAAKPIVGRTGCNVTIRNDQNEICAQSKGKFGEREMVYQALFPLTKQDDYYCILGSWMIGDVYGGTGIREDKTLITGLDSPFSAVLLTKGRVPSAQSMGDVALMAQDE